MKKDMIVAVCLAIVIVIMSYIATLGGGLGPLFNGVRPLATIYLSTT
jgi:hypothetical protein